MKFKHKIISLILVIVMCMAITVISPSAVDKNIVPIGARTGLIPLGSDQYIATLSSSADELPVRYSSKDQGYVLPVRQQQNNTCWAFGALSTFETLLLKNGENVTQFSAQHANIWGTKQEDGTGWQRSESSSGYSYIPLGYLTSQAGPVYESDFPESSTKQDYKNFAKTPEYVLTDTVFFNNDSEDTAIKELIYNYGAVVGNFYSNPSYLSQGDSYYCSDHSFSTSTLSVYGHCISVVGWDDNYKKENFSQSISGTPASDGAWIIKNSWGTHNGDEGYYYISYEDVWLFDQKFGHSYAFTGYEKITENNRIYQNEKDGATYECTYFTNQSKNPCDAITYINVFDFDKDNRTLDKVLFETTSKGADYFVHYIPTENGIPTADTSLWNTLCTGSVDNTGYICVDVDDTLLPEGKGAIGVTIDNTITYMENKDTPGYKYIANSIGVCEWLTSNRTPIFLPQAEFGMSYYIQNDKVRDLMDFYAKNFDDDIGGTFVIKALTTNAEIPDNTEPDSSSSEQPSSIPTSVSSSDLPTIPTSETTATTSIPTETTTEDISLPEPIEYLVGDSDMNKNINVKDATLIQKHLVSLEILSKAGYLAADSTSDGNVNIKDATEIQKFVAGIELDTKIGSIVFYYE